MIPRSTFSNAPEDQGLQTNGSFSDHGNDQRQRQITSSLKDIQNEILLRRFGDGVVASERMGSGSSFHSDTRGEYILRSGNFSNSTLGRDANDPLPDASKVNRSTIRGQYFHPSCKNAKYDEFAMVKRAPVREQMLKFKSSTFKGPSTSAVTRNNLSSSPEKQSYSSLSSLFAPRGKYKFSRGNSFEEDGKLSYDSAKSATLHLDSTKFHQSFPPKIAITKPEQCGSVNSHRNAGFVYGTLRNSNTGGNSGSVAELLQRSKSRVRNSLRNLKFYSRNLSAEEKSPEPPKPSEPYLLTPSGNLYDGALHDNDVDSSYTWWSDEHSTNSDASSEATSQKPTRKSALPVKVPTVDGLPSFRSKNSSKGNERFSTDIRNHTESTLSNLLTSKTPEQQSIEALDEVIGQHSQRIRNSIDSEQSSEGHSIMGQAEELHGTDTNSQITNDNASLNVKIQQLDPTSNVLVKDSEAQIEMDATRRGNFHARLQRPQTLPLDENITQKCNDVPMPFETPLVVEQGMTVSDVLNQESVSDILSTDTSKALSSSGSSLPLVASFHSQNSTNFDNESSQSSFGSGGQSPITGMSASDSEGNQQLLTSTSQIRKSGWLVAKHLLVAKRGKVELAPRRNWQKFWVNLKDGQLFFFDLDGKSIDEEVPKLTMPVSDSMIQAVPEHVKKDNIMCISTRDGNVFLLQANGQTDVDGWTQAIHTEAGILFARNESTVSKKEIKSVLRYEMKRLKSEIEMDQKMKKMADLQMTLVSEVKSRRAITEQIRKWEENLEKNHVHMFRFRCYLASLNGDEAPNPRTAIASVCKTSKQHLNSIRIFNISTLHCLVVSKHQHSNTGSNPKTMTQSRRNLTAIITRSGSFNEIKDPQFQSSQGRSIKSDNSPSKSRKSSFFASLRGFETWRGSVSSLGKKKHQRTSVTGIISAFASGSTPSSHSSTKEEFEEKYSVGTSLDSLVKKRTSNSIFYQVPMFSCDDVTASMSVDDSSMIQGGISEDELTDEHQNSNAGSLDSLLLAPPDAWSVPDDWNSSAVRVSMETGESLTVTMTEKMTFGQLLEIICQRKQLDSNAHFIEPSGQGGNVDELDCRSNKIEQEIWSTEFNNQKLPHVSDLLSDFNCQNLNLRRKKMFSVELKLKNGDFGLRMLPKAMCHPLVVESVTQGSVAEQNELHPGDEILAINGVLTAEMGAEKMQNWLNRDEMRLLVRTRHEKTMCKSQVWWIANANSNIQNGLSERAVSEEDKQRNRSEHLVAVMEDYLQKIVVPPPPVVSQMQPSFIRSPFAITKRTTLGTKHSSAEDIVSLLIVPPPDTGTTMKIGTETSSKRAEKNHGSRTSASLHGSNELIDQLLKKSEIVTSQCRQVHIMGTTILPPPALYDQRDSQSECSGGSAGSDFQRQLSELEKVKKVVQELLDTERIYVKDLECLLTRYLEPLHTEGFFTSADFDSLLRSVEGMLLFQQSFLAELSQTSHVSSLSQFRESETTSLTRDLVTIASTFLQHAAQFKLYAMFSTCHSVAQELFEQAKASSFEFRDFLEARNPKRQHSSTLESYLIKPIQRVLKYPLLLHQLLSLSESLDSVNSKARRRLKAALHAMNAVARHINDSQTVHDEFGGHGFAQVMREMSRKAFEEFDVSVSLKMNDLLCYCTTGWLNVSEEIGKMKKGNVMELLVLAFRNAVVLLCRSSKFKDKKKGQTPQQETQPQPLVNISDFVYTKVIPGSELCISGEKNTNILELSFDEPKTNLNKNIRISCEKVDSKMRLFKTLQYVIKNCRREAQLYKVGSDPLLTSQEEIDVFDGRKGFQLAENSGKPEKKCDRSLFYKAESVDSTSSLTRNGFPDVPPLPLMLLPSKMKPHQDNRNNNVKNRKTDELLGAYIPSTSQSTAGRSHSFKTFKNHFSANELYSSAPTSPVGNHNTEESRSHTQVSLHHAVNSPIKDSEELNRDCNYGDDKFKRSKFPNRYNMVYGVSPFESKL